MRKLLAVGAILLSTSTFGHEFYNSLCCNEIDCRPYTGEVTVTPEGFFLPEFGVTIPFTPHPERRPHEYGNMDAQYDGARYDMPGDDPFQYHLCELPKGTIRCFYVRPGGV